MARCGCNTAMTTTCDAIMTCIAANLGAGLDFNEETRQIELRISTDGGNIASIGADGGFYSPATTGPGEMTWPKTVATLPAQAMSASSGSSLVGPANAPEMIEYSIGSNIDIYSAGVYGVADGTIFEAPGGVTTSVTSYTDNPGAIANRYISSLTMQQLHFDAGTRINPTGRNSNAPASALTTDGGWGGFYAPVYGGRTIDETLRIVRGRIVVEFLIQRAAITTEQIEADIRATVDAVVRAGAQDWVIIQVPALLDDNSRAPIDEWVPIVTDAGIAAGVNLNSRNLMVDPFTPAEIVASGATWTAVVSLSRPDGVDDATIAALVAAGLEVVVTTSGRQYWTTHAFGLGARVVRSPDAVYSRGPRGMPGDLNYRDTWIPGLETRTTAIGALTSITDVEVAMWHPGYAVLSRPGRFFPPRYAWVDGVSRFANSQILGNICPIPNTTNFQLRIRVYRHGGTTLSNSRWAGIFWGSSHDRDISNNPGSGSNVLRNGYACVVREPTGTGPRMGIYRHDAGVETTLATSTSPPGWLSNAWVELIVTVTGTGINFQAVGETNNATVSTVDGTYRGPYAFYVWNDAGTGSATQHHGYDNGTGFIYQAM